MAFSLRDHSGQRFKIGSMLRIGRDPVNEIVLSDTNVSRLHATLSEIQAGLLLRDENSSNGTLVNGVQIRGLVQLQSGDNITIGNWTFVVENTPEPVPAVFPPPAMSNQPVYTPPIQNPVPSKPKNKGMIWPLYFIIFIMILCALPPILGAAY